MNDRHAPPAGAGARAAALLPPCFFAVAVACFAGALVGVPFVAGELHAYFYQAHVLALTHLLTLGWVSMTMLGVLYRYVPGLTKCPLPAPRLAGVQWVMFVAGMLALVSGFWRGDWNLATGAAALLVLSTLLLCRNLWPLLWRAERRGVAEVGLLAATGSLVAAATLGTLLAADKQTPLLGGSVLTNLGAHAHFAAVGWVGVTIGALSFRFLPAFLLPTVEVADAARRLVVALVVAVIALVGALLLRSPLLWPATLGVATALVSYAVLCLRVIRSHRLPVDWTTRHAVASVLWCLTAVAGGTALAAHGADTPLGAHLAAAYGVAGILGWMSNLVIGMSYRLFPGFVAAARAHTGRAAVPIATLGVSSRVQGAVLLAFNAGVAAAVGGLLADRVELLRAGSVTLAGAAGVYAAATGRTLALAVLDPRRAADPLSVLP